MLLILQEWSTKLWDVLIVIRQWSKWHLERRCKKNNSKTILKIHLKMATNSIFTHLYIPCFLNYLVLLSPRFLVFLLNFKIVILQGLELRLYKLRSVNNIKAHTKSSQEVHDGAITGHEVKEHLSYSFLSSNFNYPSVITQMSPLPIFVIVRKTRCDIFSKILCFSELYHPT